MRDYHGSVCSARLQALTGCSEDVGDRVVDPELCRIPAAWLGVTTGPAPSTSITNKAPLNFRSHTQTSRFVPCGCCHYVQFCLSPGSEKLIEPLRLRSNLQPTPTDPTSHLTTCLVTSHVFTHHISALPELSGRVIRREITPHRLPSPALTRPSSRSRKSC